MRRGDLGVKKKKKKTRIVARPCRLATPPALAGGKLHLGTADGRVLCTGPAIGKTLREEKVGGPILFRPAVVDGRVYLATDDGTVICLETGDPTADGWAMWGGSAGHNGPADRGTELASDLVLASGGARPCTLASEPDHPAGLAQRSAPLLSRPISAKPWSELAPGTDSKPNPIWEPENRPLARAGANVPRKAAGSVGATESPEPRVPAGPVASHSTLKLTVAGTAFAPANWNVLITGTSSPCSRARRLSRVRRNAPLPRRTVQKSPDGGMPPLKS